MKLTLDSAILDRLLQSMYALPNRSVLHLQDAHSCKQFVKLLLMCIEGLAPNGDGDETPEQGVSDKEPPTTGFSADEMRAVDKAISMMKGNGPDVRWLPQYGSALFAHRGEHQMPFTRTISIIGLDRHSFFLHHDDSDGYRHEANAEDYKMLIAGTLEEDKMEAFWKRFQQLLDTAKERDGDRRTAAGGRQGHQFTPTLVHALATQAIRCPCAMGTRCGCHDVTPKGGFTDVGRHTGGEPRNTSYALAKFILDWCLTQCGCTNKVLFIKLMLSVHLRILDDRVTRAEEDSIEATGEKAWKVRADLDVAFRILEVVSMEADEHEIGASTIHSVFHASNDLRNRIDKVVERLARAEADRFLLPDVDSLLRNPNSFRSPRIDLPEEAPGPALKERSFESRIKNNIGPHHVFTHNSKFDLKELLAYLKSSPFKGKDNSDTILLRLGAVENTFWNRALDGFDAACLSELEVSNLLDVVHEYRSLFQRLDTSGLMISVLRSRELLVVWIAYCLVFSTLKREIAGMGIGTYSVALRFSDLEHLVLDDRTCWRALAEVASFLNENHHSENTELFSLRAPDATNQFARAWAKNDTKLQHLLKAEMDDANQRMDKHWEEVLRKQREARRLRSEISSLTRQLDTAKVDRNDAQERYDYARSGSKYASRSELDRCESRVRSLEQKVSSRKNSLKAALKAPPPVCQPLPREEAKARVWLFFLHMPPILRDLSTLSFSAQQMLVPRPWVAECDGPDGTKVVDVFAALQITNRECLKDFYNSNQYYCFHSPREKRQGSQGDVALVSTRGLADVIPKTIGPTSVDNMSSRENGVWFPDAVTFGMEWTGGSLLCDRAMNGGAFDPFRIPRKWVISYFTEKLGIDGKSLQWTMRLEENADDAPVRGNRALACQETRPSWLSKTQFLAFCNMRSYPHRQLRSVLVALLDRSLPLEHHCVHVLLKQTLFHIGRLNVSSKGDVLFCWKRDLILGELLPALRVVLDHFVDEIKDSPSSYSSVHIVADVAGFLAGWDRDPKIAQHGELKVISRRLADAAFQWAQDFGRQAESTEQSSDVASFRIRQKLLLSLSILCSTQGPMNDNDTGLALKCRAIGKNLCIEGAEASGELAGIERRCDNINARIVVHVIDVVTRRKSFLTDAIRAVIDVVPDSLRWKPLESSSSSFFGIGSDGCNYAINVLTGTGLVNGLPPSSLPTEILEHDLYQRTFGQRNFEVVCKNEQYETVRRIGGFIYNFAFDGKSLCITETSQEGERLELLDGTSDGIQRWGDELPTRLKRMHSHWLCREKNTIFLRGMLYSKREVYFIVNLSFESKSCVGECRVVPDHLRSNILVVRDIDQSIVSFPRLVLHDSDLSRIFAKLEDRQFIHFILVGQPAILTVSLPRYGLNFTYRDGIFHCTELSGFVLKNCQQLFGCLFGFTGYLVIRQGLAKTGGVSCSSILVADGEIERSPLSGSTVIKTSTNCDESCRWHKYDLHPRFQTLSSSTVSSRLHLAALHASTSFKSPDCDTLLTGFEIATELVRGSWVSRVLSREEMTSLSRLRAICKGRHSTLSLLCSEIIQSSGSVPFLHSSDDRSEYNGTACEASADESNKYLLDLGIGVLDYRNCLTESEEKRILGQCGHRPIRRSATSVPMSSFPGQTDVSTQLENSLKELRGSLELGQDQDSQCDFPLTGKSKTPLEADIIAEQRASWEIHKETSKRPDFCEFKPDKIAIHIAGLHESTAHSRQAVEDHVLSALNNTACTENPSSVDLKRLSGVQPRATARDLLFAALRHDVLLEFVSSFSTDEERTIQPWIIEWLRLCVIEDKVGRLSELIHDKQGFIKELAVIRNWRASDFPAWLVFEVEHCIQIWPEQAAVSRHLIENIGDIVQLNMGMGKTRVILPLLILHWAFHCNNKAVPRINILPQLLSEACDFFHHRLSASVFHLKLVTLPFSRDVQLNNHKVVSMQALLSHCQDSSGFVIVAPDHRLSLDLKVKELELGKEHNLAIELRKVQECSWIDVLDESDELLHHRFQLIYAVGSVQELPGGAHRWRPVQALLNVIHKDQIVARWLKNHSDFALLGPETTVEAFRTLQVSSQNTMERIIPDFYRALAEAVFSNPPYELEWLIDHACKDSIMVSILREHEPGDWINELSDGHRSDVLALRGLLVGGILIHCLRKRHRVDFGVARPGKKKLSVPFRGADTPSLRSEFSHPDYAIVFTILSYYDDGLSGEELVAAFSTLFSLGRNVQSEIYKQWFSLSKGRMEEKDQVSLNRVEKIDLANQMQLRLLVKYYCRNIEVINFWLNSSVFPEEMQYYPQRLTATSWHLAGNSIHTVGFSGTNDNHRLLPLQVKQYFADVESADAIWQSLITTNGRMLELLINKTTDCLSLCGSNNVESIMNLIKDHPNAQAFIDAGALLAGLSNEGLARKIILLCKGNAALQWTGVVFFDNRSPNGQWMALEPSGRLLPKNQSPVQESEAFAIFDEPRCRGSDLKLRKTAAALLTIGPKMCKDKLMQAAGRMRSLAHGQSLVIAGTEFLFREIMDARRAKEVNPRVVLEWTLQNTVKANAEGLLPWADQGLFFCSSRGNIELSLEDEKLSLEDYYGGSFRDVSISVAVEKARNYHERRAREASSKVGAKEKSLMEGITCQAQRYGESVVHANGDMDAECERELELEREVEEEKEVEIPRMCPCRETNWEKATVLEAASPTDLSGIVDITSLGDFVASHVSPPSLSRYAWCERIFGTENYFKSVISQSGFPLTSLNQYLRLIDLFVYFPDRRMLLVSEREADALIRLFWDKSDNKATKTCLCHLSILRSALDEHITGLLSNMMVLGKRWGSSQRWLRSLAHDLSGHPSDYSIAATQLFAGETLYRTESRRDALANILRGQGVSLGPAVANPENLVDTRGNSHLYQYSDLERVCRGLAREEQHLLLKR